jgi:hypothetical protein
MTRTEAFKALFSGNMPVKVVERIIEKPVPQIITMRKGRTEKRVKEQGVVRTSQTWTDKIPHPPIMERLDDLNRDPEIETANTVNTEMLVGVGFYTEMPEDKTAKKTATSPNVGEHPNKILVDAYCERVNLDEKLRMVSRTAFEKGFAPVEIEDDLNIKILPPETFYIWRKKTGEVYKYTQETGGTGPVNTWEGENLKKIILFIHKETPLNPYGKSTAEAVEDFIDARREMLRDVPKVIHKLGYPFRIWLSSTKEVGDKVFEQATNREPDEDLFFDNVQEGQLKVVSPDTVQGRINFPDFITHNDEMVAEGLFSPLMIYLRNATEASATKMLEAIDRFINGLQRYYKRRIEEKIFSLVVTSGPIPRLVFGSPKTGLEKIQLADIGSLYRDKAITFTQVQDLLKKLGVPLVDIAPGENPELPGIPPEIPMLDTGRQQVVATNLEIIYDNFKEGRITLTEAFTEGNKVIETHIDKARQTAKKRLEQELDVRIDELAPETEASFTYIKNELTARFRNRLIPHGGHADVAGKPRSFHVEPQY